MFYFSPLTSRANSFSVDSFVCSRLPFRLCHSMHTLAPFQSHARVFGGSFFFFFTSDAEWWRWNRWNLFYSFPLSLSVSQGWQNFTWIMYTGSRTWARSHTPTQTRSHTSLADSWIQYFHPVFWFSLMASLGDSATFSTISLNPNGYFEVSHIVSPPPLAPIVRVQFQCSHAFHYR